jgi:hypothetical protein
MASMPAGRSRGLVRVGDERKKGSSTPTTERRLAQERGMGFGMTSSPDEIERETVESLQTAVRTLEAKSYGG